MGFSVRFGRRTTTAASVAALVLGSSLIAAAPAQAYTSCPSDGYVDRYNVCTKLTNGVLGHHKSLNSGAYTQIVSTDYYKSGGSTIYRRLGFSAPFTDVPTQWSGWANQSSGTDTFRKYYYESLNYCNATQGLMEVSGSTVYKTPWTADC
jgi:hypothetical protein